jgi:tRNA(His) 5'-end guanylyltransferase
MFSRGVNLAKTPGWQRRGILVYRKEEEKAGYDPRAGEPVETVRRVVTIDWDLPVFSSPEGRAFLEGILGSP